MSIAVELARGDEASGLASMLATLLEDNLRDFRSRSFAARMTRGDVVLVASDRDIAVTLSFRPGGIVIDDDRVPGAPVLMGSWLDLTKICSGQRSPIAALAARELRVTRGRNMRAAAGAGVVLAVPKSFYAEQSEVRAHRRRTVLLASIFVAGVLLAAVVFASQRGGVR